MNWVEKSEERIRLGTGYRYPICPRKMLLLITRNSPAVQPAIKHCNGPGLSV